MSAETTTGQGQLLIDSQLTQQYRKANPVGGILIAPLCDAHGVLHVFAVGSNNHLFDVYQDPSSDTGWTMVDMKFTGSAAIKQVVAGIEKDGTTIVFVADNSGKLYYIRLGSSGGWQNFTTITATTVQALKVCRDKNGSLLLAISAQDQSNSPGLYWADYTTGDNWGIGNVNPAPTNYWAVTQLNDFQVGLDASAGNANGLSVYLSGLCSNALNSTNYTPSGKKSAWPNGTPPWSSSPPDVFWAWNVAKGFTRIALAPNPAKANDSVLLTLKGSDSGLYLVNVASQQMQKLSGSVQLSEIAADLDSKAGISVFGLGADHRLYNVHQDGAGWTDMMMLNAQMSVVGFRLARDANGNVMAFAIDSTLKLWQVWRDAATQEWHFAQVDVGTGPMHEYGAYRTQITLENVPPSAQVELWSSGLTPAMVNGQDVGLNPQVATVVQTNAAGQVTVVIPADGIDTPTLSVHAGFMEEAERVVIEPNAGIQARLRAVSADDLLNAKGFNGKRVTLLTGKYNTPAVAQALAQGLNQMMAMAGADPASTDRVARRYLAPKTRPHAARRISLREGVAPGRIDLASVPDLHWQIDFKSGFPVFSTLTRAGAAELMAQRRASTRSLSDWGWDIDWGEVWDSVTDTVTEVVDVVVSAVVDTVNNVVTEIEAQVTVMIGEIRAVLDASIEFVEQVFKMAEGILAKVEVMWDQLQQWLGFLFDWDDISRTAQVLAYMFGVGFDFIEQATAHVRTAVDAKINEAQNFLHTGMDQFIASLAGQQTVGGFTQSSTPSVPLFDERVGNNPLFDAFMTFYGGATPPSLPRARAAAIDSTVQKVIDLLTKLATEFNENSTNQDAAQAFAEARTYFTSIADNPDNILQLSLLGLLKLGESIALYGLQGIKLLLDVYFDAMAAVVAALREFLIEPWQIPVVTDLYEYLFDRRFVSLAELFAAIVATPVTAIYKAERDAAPYPGDDAVKQVTGTLNATWLGQRAWGATGAAPAAGDTDWLNVLRYVFNAAQSVDWITRCVVEGAINANPKPDSVLPFVNWIQRYLSSVFSIPWIFKDTVAPPWPDDADGWENFIWVLQYICGPLRGGILLIAEAPGQVGDATLAIWGAVHLVLVCQLADLQAQKTPPVRNLDEWIAEAVQTCLCPQMLKVLRLPPFPELTVDLCYPALGLATLGSESSIASLHADRTLLVAGRSAAR